jgi:hypothetical protein
MCIKFVAVERWISSPLSDPESYVHNLSNNKLAEKLNDRFENKYCPDHPSVESVVEVDMARPTDQWLKLKNYCCDRWREKLDRICENQDPFLKDKID